MSTTSKPVATPEMVEKARLWLLEHGFKGNTVIMAEFAASAVQDAVSVACQIMAREIEHWDYSDIPAEDAVEIALDNAAAALREKYGVTP